MQERVSYSAADFDESYEEPGLDDAAERLFDPASYFETAGELLEALRESHLDAALTGGFDLEAGLAAGAAAAAAAGSLAERFGEKLGLVDRGGDGGNGHNGSGDAQAAGFGAATRRDD